MEISVVQIQVETERGVYSSSIVICLSAHTFFCVALFAGRPLDSSTSRSTVDLRMGTFCNNANCYDAQRLHRVGQARVSMLKGCTELARLELARLQRRSAHGICTA